MTHLPLTWAIIGGLLSAACLVGSQLTTTGIITTSADVNCSSVDTTECSACLPGTYSGNGSCLCCSSGNCINASDCLACPSGFYQPLRGQASCLPCLQGFYTNTSESMLCQPCQPGFYSSENSSVFCTPCGKGSFSSLENTTRCDPCTSGSFCNATGCTSCASCPPGEEALEVGSIDCMPCSPGMYKRPGDLRCLYCQDGEYQTNSGADHCDLCPVDHYCPSPDISPISCLEDAFCPPGSTEPTYCMETFLRKAGDACKLAPFTILLLVICAAVLCLSVIWAVRKRRRNIHRRSMISFSPESPLLKPHRTSSPSYGMTHDAEPVYAGW